MAERHGCTGQPTFRCDVEGRAYCSALSVGRYVVAMRAMLKQAGLEDFIIAAGEAHSLQGFAKLAFAELGLDYQAHIDFDPGATRPSDIAGSLGDARKAEPLLDWKPKVRFPDIVARIVRGEREGP